MTLVVITDSDLSSTADEEVLRAAGLDVRRERCRTEDDVAAAAADADALLVQWAAVGARALDALPRCRFISRLGIGYDMIDVAAAAARGVAVANTPDYCVEEVATHTVAMVLDAARGIVALDRSVREGRWEPVAAYPAARRPSATTVAVVGMGRIGVRVVRAAVALGFRVVVADPQVTDAAVEQTGATAMPLDEALAAADVVTLHVPLTPATHHLLDAAALARLRPGARLVNTCRGGLVDTDALVTAIRDGRVAGAALDVFETEPLPATSPLRDLPGVVLTPHAAWYSPDALEELPRRAAQNVVDFFDGRPVPLVNEVPRPVAATPS